MPPNTPLITILFDASAAAGFDSDYARYHDTAITPAIELLCWLICAIAAGV